MLDRKHFEKVAEIIKGIPAQMNDLGIEGLNYDEVRLIERTRNLIADNLADYFEEESAYFDRIKFLEACDLGILE